MIKEQDIFNKYGLREVEGEDGYLHAYQGDEEFEGCLHCFIQEKAYSELNPIQSDGQGGLKPLCPKCGKILLPYTKYGYSDVVVSEQNSYVPDGNIGLYRTYHCEDCDQDYAMMPIPISWNANHDTHYTGGRRFAEDADTEAIVKDLWEKISPQIKNYVERKANPEDWNDERLEPWNVLSWSRGEVEHVVCNWLYEHGFKK